MPRTPLLLLPFLLLACESPATPTAIPPAPAHDPAPSAQAPPPVQDKFTLQHTTHTLAPGATLHVEVRPGSGYKINPEYPWKFTLTDPGGATFDHLPQGATLTKKDALLVESSRAQIPLTLAAATPPGSYTVAGTLNLSVCEQGNEARCLWFTDEPVNLALTVEAQAGATE